MPRFLPVLVLLFLATACGPGSGSNFGVASFVNENTEGTVGIGNAQSGGDKGNSVAQSFRLTEAADVRSVSVKLERRGTLADYQSLTLSLDTSATGGEYPAGTPLSPSATAILKVTDITDPRYYRFVFPSAVALGANTTYWIRLKASYQISSSNYIAWRGYQGDPAFGYADGVALYLTTGGSWSDSLIGTDTDLNFTVDR
ncbi:MAG: hypothetical protein NDJ90_09915 [Oligoflexia bacterium]|nr:hypothetical protein [Oligoflexia bacterium]